MRLASILCLLALLSPLSAATDQPSVILITLDTVRADRMGFLGSKRGLTPQLDGLAHQSVVFERAYSQAPLTPVSHATILSGTYPRFHGVRDFGVRLPVSTPYLPELLRTRGYHTAAFVSSIILDPKNGFAPGFERGFDVYDAGFHRGKRGENRLGSMQRRGEETVTRALAWLEKNRQGPVFLWIHLWDAHDPYDPPEPFRTTYPKAPYDGCLAYVDATVGKLLTGLRGVGIYDDALVAVMSDHGESLGEHGENTHGVFLYDSTIRVPLLIKFPKAKYAGQRVATRASLVDVAPTLLEAMQASIPPAMQGQSLVPFIGKTAEHDRPALAENEYTHRGYGWSALEALRTGKFLFVRAPQPELYDQTTDSGDTSNLYERNKLAAARISAQLEDFLKHAGTGAPEEAHATLDAASVEKLRALGYVASIGAEKATSSVDPKTHIQVSNDLHDANLRIEEGKETTAIPLLERVVASDPQIPHAQYFLGVAYKEIRQYDKAIPHLKRAIELVPDSMMAQYEMALALYEKGELKTSATYFEIVVEHSPDWTDARFSLAAVYARIDRLPEALGLLDMTLELDPEHYRANLLRGRILSLKGDQADALPNLEKAVKLEPKSVEAHLFLGEAYSQLGRDEDAARERGAAERLKASSP
ncbi:MAG TPA: sulfatase-like hydrolase/transferase [Candidatus Acidoferrum sp.]|nr:sulfatase-like hydrolase/transferase [Candidatus Acidoferrum sp.]